MIHPLRQRTEQRERNDLRQIVRMNMVGVHIVLRHQRRRTLFQAFQRQTVGGVNPGHAQDRELALIALRPAPQHPLGIHTSLGACVHRCDGSGLVKENALTIAIHARRADINDPRVSG